MVKNYGEELGWEVGVDFPEWGNTEIYVKTISKGYLMEGEKPKDAYWRVATTVAKRLHKPHMASKFFDFKTIIPCHYRTFPLLEQNADVLAAAVPSAHVIEPQVMQAIDI